MESFFQAGIGFDMMANRMEEMMNMFEPIGRHHPEKLSAPCFQSEPIKIPEEYAKEARFRAGYDEENDPVEVRKMIKQKLNQSQHSYDAFEEKLEKGILDSPNLNLHQVPPSVFDNDPPITIMYLKDNQICELPEFFFDELPFLTWLDLRDNKLTNLPSLNSRHECLRVFLLQGNRIRALPYTLALAVNLQTIGITGNPLTIPPENVQKQGCKKMIEYFQARMLMRIPLDESGELESEDDNKLREDLKQTAMKCVKQKTTPSLILRGQESVSTDISVAEKKRRADRLIYTWELWKRIPYDGVSRTDMFEKSLEEVRNQVLKRLNIQQEALLQKCKNQDVLRKWRSETKLMQMRSKPDLKVNLAESAPFGNDLNEVKLSNSRLLRPLEYKQELEDCWDKLKRFSENPAQLLDTELALKRLREVEEIHKRLLEMKLSVKPTLL